MTNESFAMVRQKFSSREEYGFSREVCSSVKNTGFPIPNPSADGGQHVLVIGNYLVTTGNSSAYRSVMKRKLVIFPIYQTIFRVLSWFS